MTTARQINKRPIADSPDFLPPLMGSEEDAMAEALRRNAEMNSNPGIGVSLRDFERRIRMRT
jgi:hypothetical protein